MLYSTKQNSFECHCKCTTSEAAVPDVFQMCVPKNFTIFTGKHLCWNLLLIKLQTNFIKNRLQHSYFPVNIAKYLRTGFFYRTLQVADSAIYKSLPDNFHKLPYIIIISHTERHLSLLPNMQCQIPKVTVVTNLKTNSLVCPIEFQFLETGNWSCSE